MAENKQEKRTLKWGDSEYLVDDILKAHAAQENSFYDFARNRGQYDETALAGLRTAIANRINAVKEGRSFDADGVLEGDVVDNTSIQTQKKGLFKKDKYVDQDNTEWAKYYLNKLVGNLTPYQREAIKKSGGWDITKHGLASYLTGQGLNAQDIFEKYDGRDANNPSAARGFAQRDAKLREHLGGYKNWLAGKGFDFTKNDNEWDDDFMTSLDSLISNKDWSDRMSVAASLRKLGAGEDYTTAFTSDKWDLSKSNGQISEDAKKKEEDLKAKEEREKYAKFAKDAYGTYSALSDNNLGGTYFTTKGDGLFALNDSEYEDWLNTHTNDKDAYMNALQTKYLKNPFDTQAASEYLPLAHRFGAIKEVDIDGKTWMYDPRTIDRKNNRVVVFDKDTGEMKHTFLGDIKEEWDSIKKKWRIDNGYEDPSEKYTSYNEEGGVLTLQTGGGFNLAQAVNRDLEERNRKRAKETGNSEEVQKARDRVVSNGDDSFTSEDPSIGSPDAGFTAAEKVRLGSIAADIGSIFLDPVTGVAVGLGSTLATFGADVMDDGFQWEDVKNLGINAGFDLVGAIPLFGDAVGTGAKITRKLVKYAPRVMAGLAAYQGVKNFDGMMESWSKFASGDKDQKLTVQDWRNIAQSISLVTGGIRAGKNKMQQSKMRSEARLDGVLGINIRNKNTGDIEQVLVDGDTAKRIKEAKGDITKIENVLNDLDAYKGKFGEKGDFVVNTKTDGSFQSPFHRRELTDGSGKKEWEYRGFRQNGRADINEVYDFNKVKSGYNSGRGYKLPGSDKLNKWHQELVAKANSKLSPTQSDQRGKLTNEAFEAEQTKLLNDQGVEAQIGKVKAAVEAHKKAATNIEQHINKTNAALVEQQRLAGGDDLVARQADAEARLRGLPDNDAINKARNDIEHYQAVIRDNKTTRKGLSTRRAQQMADAESGIKGKVTKKQEEIDDLKKTLISAKSRLAAAQKADAKKGITRSHKKLEQRVVDLETSLNTAKADLKTLKKNNPKDLADALARIQSNFNRAYKDLDASTRNAKGSIATAQPIAAQRKAYSEAYTQQQAAIAGQELQKKLDNLRGRKSAHDPATTRTRAYKDLETTLNNLRASNPTIGGKTVAWDMAEILKRYGINASDVFKQGGSINRNKINKFLNYAKG